MINAFQKRESLPVGSLSIFLKLVLPKIIKYVYIVTIRNPRLMDRINGHGDWQLKGLSRF